MPPLCGAASVDAQALLGDPALYPSWQVRHVPPEHAQRVHASLRELLDVLCWPPCCQGVPYFVAVRSSVARPVLPTPAGGPVARVVTPAALCSLRHGGRAASCRLGGSTARCTHAGAAGSSLGGCEQPIPRWVQEVCPPPDPFLLPRLTRAELRPCCELLAFLALGCAAHC
jgi:hypothetical protein